MREYLTKEEARRFLEYGHRPSDLLMKRLLLFSGMRIGECAALQARDIDLEGRQIFLSKSIVVASQLGKINTSYTSPKGKKYPYLNPKRKLVVFTAEGEKHRGTVAELAELGLKGELVKEGLKANEEGRTVPLTDQATLELLNLQLRSMDPEGFLFISQMTGKRTTKTQLYRIVKKHLEKAGIPSKKCHPHILRHTYAVGYLNAGGDLRTLQLNLGHSKIETTAIYLKMSAEDRVSKMETIDFGY